MGHWKAGLLRAFNDFSQVTDLELCFGHGDPAGLCLLFILKFVIYNPGNFFMKTGFEPYGSSKMNKVMYMFLVR